MSSKKKTVGILRRMNKTGDQIYDGLNSNAPTLYPGGNFNDGYRKVERQNVSDLRAKTFIDNLELSRRIMSIDIKSYNVDEESATKLLDYIEQNNFDVINELELELKTKSKELKKKVDSLIEVDISNYITEDDYIRAVTNRKKELMIFSNKVLYLESVIKTIKRYEKELKELDEYTNLAEKPDFSYNYTNWNSAQDGAGKLK